jgi:hypothetical protein
VKDGAYWCWQNVVPDVTKDVKGIRSGAVSQPCADGADVIKDHIWKPCLAKKWKFVFVLFEESQGGRWDDDDRQRAAGLLDIGDVAGMRDNLAQTLG